MIYFWVALVVAICENTWAWCYAKKVPDSKTIMPAIFLGWILWSIALILIFAGTYRG